MNKQIEYTGVVLYNDYRDLQKLRDLGATFLSDKGFRFKGRLCREVMIPEESMEKLEPLWGRIQWSLVPTKVASA